MSSLEFLSGNPLGQTRTEKIYQPVEGWVIEYENIDKMADEQFDALWPWNEPEVENDIADLRVNCTESEKHGIITTLKLFTHYEIHAGDDYWTGRFMNTFPRPEFKRLGSLFGAVEMNSHAPFYNKINESLYLDTEEFYGEWRSSEVLRERMKFIGKIIGSEDDLLSLAGFSFIEGAVLYSSFAFLKHFQAQECGKDLIKNICRGVNLSVGDENLHAVGGATVFQILKKERNLTSEQEELLADIITKIAVECYEHEAEIVEMLFSKGEIPGLTKQSLLDFVKHRINICLENLGVKPLFDKEELDGFIESWFYRNINSFQMHDFFSGGGSEYSINWKRERFGKVWSKN